MQPKMLFSIEAIIDRIEGGKAVLEIAANWKIKLSSQQIIWPKTKLPPNIKEGDVVELGLLKKEDVTKQKEAAAREMLNALLRSGNKNKNGPKG